MRSATRIGENVLTFMAVLYALRGAAPCWLVIGGVRRVRWVW
jgi:hypothetical protein